MKFEHIKTYGWEGAFRGMRNPMQSWGKSDSFYEIFEIDESTFIESVIHSWIVYELGNEDEYSKLMYGFNKDPKRLERLEEKYFEWLITQGLLTDFPEQEAQEAFWIGPNDLTLAQKLIKAGTEHSKFMRQIFISLDITAPLYWWKQFDTYKVGTVVNSTSTMHKITSKPITLDCFELDDYTPDLQMIDPIHLSIRVDQLISDLEQLRQLYLATKDFQYWKQLIRWLPESWLQTRTVTMSYANFRHIYLQRKNHKLTEWYQFCDLINTLPYGKELINPEGIQLDN